MDLSFLLDLLLNHRAVIAIAVVLGLGFAIRSRFSDRSAHPPPSADVEEEYFIHLEFDEDRDAEHGWHDDCSDGLADEDDLDR